MTAGKQKTINCGTVTVPKNIEFDMERAQELIALGKEARLLYQKGRELEEQNSNQDKDLSELIKAFLSGKELPLDSDAPDPIKGKQYKVLAPLVFTQVILQFIQQRRVFGFIAEPTDTERQGKEIFIVYRGSQTQGDWFSNLRIIQTKRKLFPSKNGQDKIQGEVHRGFHAQYTRRDSQRNQPSISEIIATTLTKEVVAGKTIYITGHSLGGALATLTAAHVKLLHPDTDVHLYTSASPRVGDKAFQKSFQALGIKKAFRIFNTEDKVPKLPPPLELPFQNPQYEHIGENLEFTSDTGSIQFNHTLPIYARALGLNHTQFNYLNNDDGTPQDLPFECSL